MSKSPLSVASTSVVSASESEDERSVAPRTPTPQAALSRQWLPTADPFGVAQASAPLQHYAAAPVGVAEPTAWNAVAQDPSTVGPVFFVPVYICWWGESECPAWTPPVVPEPTGCGCGWEQPAPLDILHGLCSESSRRFRAAEKLVPLEQYGSWMLEDVARPLALSRHGCRLLQQAMAAGSDEERGVCLERLLGSARELCESPHGNYCLQLLAQTAPMAAVALLVDVVAPMAEALARHRFGSRVLQRLIERCSDEALRGLETELLRLAPMLSAEQFGSKVLVTFVERRGERSQLGLLWELRAGFATLADDEYGSFLCQKFFERGTSTVQRRAFDCLWSSQSTLMRLAFQKYGSFVVEHVLQCAPLRGQAQRVLRPRAAALGSSKYGWRIATEVDSA